MGTWTWTWMEPMIGTASFVLLSFQLIRSHMQRIDLKPFGRYSKTHEMCWAKKERKRVRNGVGCCFSPALERTLGFALSKSSHNFVRFIHSLITVESRRADFLAKKVNST